MLSLVRLTSFFLLVLSMGFLTCAAPTLKTAELAVRDYGYSNGADSPDPMVLQALVDLGTRVEASLNILAKVDTIAMVNVNAAIIVADVQATAAVILAIGTNVKVDADIKAKIAAQIVLIIKIIVKAFMDISIKFGLDALITVLATIDACIHLLLVNVDICMEGVVEICAGLLIDVSAKVWVEANLQLCATLLVLISA